MTSVIRLDKYLKDLKVAEECRGATEDSGSDSDQEVSSDDCDFSDFGVDLGNDA